MRPYTGTSKLRRTAAVLCGSIAALSVTACAVDAGRMASLRPPPYLALNSGPAPGSLSRETGYLTEERGCLVFRSIDGRRAITPVFPAATTSLVTDGEDWLGLYVGEAPIGMGKSYQLRGAAVASPASMELKRPMNLNCPGSYFLVRSFATSMADADLWPCRGTIYCMSFRFN